MYLDVCFGSASFCRLPSELPRPSFATRTHTHTHAGVDGSPEAGQRASGVRRPQRWGGDGAHGTGRRQRIFRGTSFVSKLNSLYFTARFTAACLSFLGVSWLPARSFFFFYCRIQAFCCWSMEPRDEPTPCNRCSVRTVSYGTVNGVYFCVPPVPHSSWLSRFPPTTKHTHTHTHLPASMYVCILRYLG